jgi:hypothetical protein
MWIGACCKSAHEEARLWLLLTEAKMETFWMDAVDGDSLDGGEVDMYMCAKVEYQTYSFVVSQGVTRCCVHKASAGGCGAQIVGELALAFFTQAYAVHSLMCPVTLPSVQQCFPSSVLASLRPSFGQSMHAPTSACIEQSSSSCMHPSVHASWHQSLQPGSESARLMMQPTAPAPMCQPCAGRHPEGLTSQICSPFSQSGSQLVSQRTRCT